MIIKTFKVDKSIVLSIVIASEIICTDTAHTQSSGCFTRVSPVRPKIEVYLHYADPTPIGVDDASSIPPALCLLASKAGRYEVVLAGAQVWVPRSEFSTGQTSVQPISTRQYAPAAGPAASANPGANGSVTTQVGQGAESSGVKTLDRHYSGGKWNANPAGGSFLRRSPYGKGGANQARPPMQRFMPPSTLVQPTPHINFPVGAGRFTR